VVASSSNMLARLAHVDLTTVSQDAHQQAERAVELAVERLEGRRTAPREVVLAPHLVVRSTTAPPREDEGGPGFAVPPRLCAVPPRLCAAG
jgi:DNA-binding LacI/PurR family transcriptional regulator